MKRHERLRRTSRSIVPGGYERGKAKGKGRASSAKTVGESHTGIALELMDKGNLYVLRVLQVLRRSQRSMIRFTLLMGFVKRQVVSF